MGWVVSTMAQLLYPWEGPGTPCTEGCMDLGAGVGKQKIMRPRDSTPVPTTLSSLPSDIVSEYSFLQVMEWMR